MLSLINKLNASGYGPASKIPESSLCGNCPERAALFVALLNERSKRGRLLEGTFRGKDATRREENRSVAGQSGPAKGPRSQEAEEPRSQGAKEPRSREIRPY